MGLTFALMGYAAMDNVQTIATVFGQTLVAVVTNGVAGALIAKVLNRGEGAVSRAERAGVSSR